LTEFCHPLEWCRDFWLVTRVGKYAGYKYLYFNNFSLFFFCRGSHFLKLSHLLCVAMMPTFAANMGRMKLS
jgi:hypothetical protein